MATSNKINVTHIAAGFALGFAAHRLLKLLLNPSAIASEATINGARYVTYKYRPQSDSSIAPLDPPSPTSDNVSTHLLSGGKKVRIPFDKLSTFMEKSFRAYGVTPSDAAICADVLIGSDKRGIDSHGIGRLYPIYCERMEAKILNATSRITIVNQTETTAVLDGGLGIGLAIGPRAMTLAINKASAHGISCVAVRNSTHYGFAGYYALMGAESDCICITGTNARPSVAPTYGTEPMLGTNPLVFGFPSGDDFPFVLDCATSVNQRGKIEKYAREGAAVPPGAVIDDEGNELTDAKLILKKMIERKCACTPLGGAGDKMAGYKGFGFALVVEAMCAALQDNVFGELCADTYMEDGQKKRRPSAIGHFFIAINIESFIKTSEFRGIVGKIMTSMRSSRKDPNYGGRIYTAGEPEQLAYEDRMKKGGTPVPPILCEQMRKIRDTKFTADDQHWFDANFGTDFGLKQ